MSWEVGGGRIAATIMRSIWAPLEAILVAIGVFIRRWILCVMVRKVWVGSRV